MRIVFAGTPEFAAVHLRALLDAGRDVQAVFTQPDRRAGRGRKPHPSPVKTLALEYGLDILQPASLKNESALRGLAEFKPGLLIVVAYGLILPRAALDLPRLGCINVHASLLPRWRGAAPIQRAILAGDPETGISIMRMDEGLDTGPVFRSARCPIGKRDNAQVLHDRLAALGAGTLLETLMELEKAMPEPVPQDDNQATYAAKLEKSEARLLWSQPANGLERHIRAFNPWPVAFTTLGGDNLRIWEAEASPTNVSAPCGRIVGAGRGSIDAVTGDGILRILKLQLPGRRPITAADYLNAHGSPVGKTLGA